jgi:tetratricopeptide (TPR) repeat protein
MKMHDMELKKNYIDYLKTVASGLLCLFYFGIVSAQKKIENKEQLREEREALGFLSEANNEISQDNFVGAEVNYRKSIAINPSEEIGKYNLGNAYYNEEKNDEAMRRFAQAAAISESKPEKHRAFHNLGNTFMNAKKYQEAVEAYKNALRNNPTDEETRYNLALAKEMLEKNPPQGGDGDDKKEDQKENEDEKKDDNQNKNDDGKDKESDDGEKKEDKDKGDQKDEKKEGDNKEEGKPDEPEEKQEPKQQPVPGQLSPQQIKNLLEAMNNEEKKVQDKINAKKQKGAKVKSNKDW